MFKAKVHKNSAYNNMKHWQCPYCLSKEVAITIFPDSCHNCGETLPFLFDLLSRVSARAAYHFAKRYQSNSN